MESLAFLPRDEVKSILFGRTGVCCQIWGASSLLQRIREGKPAFVAALLQWIEARGWQLMGSLVWVMWRFQQLDYCWESWGKDWCPSGMS